MRKFEIEVIEALGPPCETYSEKLAAASRQVALDATKLWAGKYNIASSKLGDTIRPHFADSVATTIGLLTQVLTDLAKDSQHNDGGFNDRPPLVYDEVFCGIEDAAAVLLDILTFRRHFDGAWRRYTQLLSALTKRRPM